MLRNYPVVWLQFSHWRASGVQQPRRFTDGYQYFGSGLGIGQCGIDAYGNIYIQGYGGEVYCYATANGDLLWQFGNGGEGNSTNDGINSPWGLLTHNGNRCCRWNGLRLHYSAWKRRSITLLLKRNGILP